MDPSTYYITTLTNAFTKITPFVVFLLVGYFIFIKLPFLFFLKNMRDNKQKFEEEKRKSPGEIKTAYSLQDYKDFQRRMRTIQAPKEAKKEAPPKEEFKQEQKKEKKEDKAQDKKKAQAPKQQDLSAEEVFNFKPGERFTAEEVRRRYHELLRQNHPDKVAQMGEDFKKLAEQKTKSINQAYAKLKAKASDKAS